MRLHALVMLIYRGCIATIYLLDETTRIEVITGSAAVTWSGYLIGGIGMLKPEQLEAVKYLSQPKNGGFTHDEIAEKVGVSRQSLYRWRQDIEFQDEIKREINRNTITRIPEVIESLFIQATKANQPSAKAAELLLKTVSMLNDRLEVEDRTKRPSEPTSDIDTMKAEIARMRQLRQVK
jgi:transposase-like protein